MESIKVFFFFFLDIDINVSNNLCILVKPRTIVLCFDLKKTAENLFLMCFLQINLR